MQSFEEQLNNVAVSENLNIRLQFESFLMKKPELKYNFIYMTPDYNNVIHSSSVHEIGFNRFIVYSKPCREVRKFLKVIPYSIKEGFLQTLVAQLITINNTTLNINVYGHTEYDSFKKLALAFVSKYSDYKVNLNLETANSDYVYDDVVVYGFWKIFKSLFITVKTQINE